MSLEFRINSTSALNLNGRTVVGYPVVFNSWSKPVRTKEGKVFVERIMTNAFTPALQSDGETKALIDHDANRVLARRSKGTLQLAQDQRGLKAVVQLPNTTLGRDTEVQLARGDLDAWSFAFLDANDSWTRRADGTMERTVISIGRLDDITLTSNPAYAATVGEIALRCIDARIIEWEKLTVWRPRRPQPRALYTPNNLTYTW